MASPASVLEALAKFDLPGLLLLNDLDKSISIAYILDKNVNNLNSFYYIYILPFICILISIINLMGYKTKGKQKNLERYLLRKKDKNNKMPETAFPLFLVVFIIWLYATPPSYEEESLTLLNAAVKTRLGFAILNISISSMLIVFSLAATVALYNHYFLQSEK